MHTRDTFRKQDFGDVEFDVNTKSMMGDRYIDHSRLGQHEEWVPNSDPKKPGKIVMSADSVENNVLRSAGNLRSRSSYRNQADGKQGKNSALGKWGW